MNLQSMTGFARSTAEHEGTALVWEIRSVNGKGLDARFRLPPGFERLEQPARQAVHRCFVRGNVQAVLTLSRTGLAIRPVVNEAFLAEVATVAKRLEQQFGLALASADGLLSLRGALEMPEAQEDEEERALLDAAILALLDQALCELGDARRVEGEALKVILGGHIDRIEALTLAAEADPSREPVAIRERIAEQLRLLLDNGTALDETRLYMEIALLATKADIREEIDRLKSHIAASRALLSGGGPIGRKLDFLSQEFNREANTLCSKSNAVTVTEIGLQLKVVVDQFREQLQNLE